MWHLFSGQSHFINNFSISVEIRWVCSNPNSKQVIATNFTHGVAYMSVNRVSIGSDNGLSLIRRQAITWTNSRFIINWTLRNKLQWSFSGKSNFFIQENAFENVACEMSAILSRGRWVKKTCLTLEVITALTGGLAPSSLGHQHLMTSSNGSIYSRFIGPGWWKPPVTGGFPSQRPVTRCFDVFFDLRLNKRLSKQSRRRWFETPSRPLWRHCNDFFRSYPVDPR